MKTRDMYMRVWNELSAEKSMIFLAGPRQAGKTTLSKIIARSFTNSLYFNWDIAEHRGLFLGNPLFFENIRRKDMTIPLIILDEIHKYKNWKNYLKGVYDQFFDAYKFLVSGSGRLDLYQKGGDSLAGRYYLFHLFPFTIAELNAKRSISIEDFLKNPLHIPSENKTELKEIWKTLSKVGGFPEPYLSGRQTAYRRWSNTYSHQLIREDIRDMIDVRSVTDMENLYMLLPSKVGSPVSIPSLSSDLKAAYNSIGNWLAVFERFFLIFSVPTWTAKISRAIQKEKKVYLLDYARIKDQAARFENMVALELHRAVTLWNDLGHGNFSLYFVKNKEKLEVDFLMAKDGEPFLLIEAKLKDTQPSKPLTTFQGALKIPAVQLTDAGEDFRIFSNNGNKILIVPAYRWLSQLP